MSEAEVVTVWSTVVDRAQGESLVGQLLDERLIACGTIFPGVSSIYRWNGEVRSEEECVLMLKTIAGRVENLLNRAAELHPYDVPELLVIPTLDGHRPYLDWVAAEALAHKDRA